MAVTLAFDPGAFHFFRTLNQMTTGHLVCEPRHETWFGPEADALLDDCHVARALVDGSRHPLAHRAGGWLKLIYRRLHGSSPALDPSDRGGGAETWCIFDNSVAGVVAASALVSTTKPAMLEAG